MNDKTLMMVEWEELGSIVQVQAPVRINRNFPKKKKKKDLDLGLTQKPNGLEFSVLNSVFWQSRLQTKCSTCATCRPPPMLLHQFCLAAAAGPSFGLAFSLTCQWLQAPGQGRLGHRLLKYAQLTAPAILVLLPPFSAVTFRAELSLIFVLNLQLFHCDSLSELQTRS